MKLPISGHHSWRMEVKIARTEGVDNDKVNTQPGDTGSGGQISITEERGIFIYFKSCGIEYVS